ncbi:PilZ domain-containing protein [Larsenimonas suaedae]|uniref:PilZ domain-containing protein n=1 Tax=Larsenimonas suaedae TaxID=1851019 RepID=A0ABU1GT59_9GAMM|nr:PilZ domain-containing protein [Larsenimonas suaedae]MCM2972189.1 PilZ domain-containing protein [Larsenimonas suaedae]MDR5895015.1 PilZ domain-containing protein [Larsenimonas suaedae]
MHKLLTQPSDDTRQPTTPAETDTNVQRIARRLALLAHEKRDISILTEGAKLPLVGRITAVDGAQGTLSIELIDLERPPEDTALARGSLTLEVRLPPTRQSSTEHLRFDEVQSLGLHRDPHRSVLLCTLPHSFFSSTKRGEMRVPLIQGLQAKAMITAYPEATAFTAELCNLSIGGCMVEAPLNECSDIRLDMTLPDITLEFPNGERVTLTARVIHLRQAARTHFASLGLEFDAPSPQAVQRLTYFLNEMESELAYRLGMHSKTAHSSPLFKGPGEAGRLTLTEPKDERDTLPLMYAMREVARRLHSALIALRNEETLARASLIDCADTIIHMLERKPHRCMYAACCLSDEPPLLQQAIRCAVQLGDLILREPTLVEHARHAILGALLHNLGKSLMIGETLPTLHEPLTPEQSDYLTHHRETLLARLEHEDWLDLTLIRRMIAVGAHNPDGRLEDTPEDNDQLRQILKLFNVIKRITVLLRPYTLEQANLTPLEAYKTIYRQAEIYDPDCVIRYVQRQGIYPIGSLIYFSRGFLAWVMSVDARGEPTKVHVIKNMNDSIGSLSTVLSRVDFDQMGEIACSIRPRDYGLDPS